MYKMVGADPYWLGRTHRIIKHKEIKGKTVQICISTTNELPLSASKTSKKKCTAYKQYIKIGYKTIQQTVTLSPSHHRKFFKKCREKLIS